MTATLDIWTIYDRPTDYPDRFVARLWSNGQITNQMMFADTLDDMRSWLAEMGLTKVMRSPGDDPVIVESWL